jgi:hypothetical protein
VTVSIWLVALVVPMHGITIGSLSPGSGDPFTLWFDENAHGLISINGGPVMSNPGLLGVEPLSGMIALYYSLPEAVGPGDIGISEATGDLSDGLRFENGLFGVPAVMFYFSDNSDANDVDLADTGFPAGFSCCSVAEVGPEGNNHFDYFPGGNVYHGISDVPEPGGLGLFGAGMLGLVGVFRRKLGF